MKILFEAVKGITYGGIGGLVTWVATALYIKRLDRQLIESIEATMRVVDDAIPDECIHGPESPITHTSFVIAIPPDNEGLN